MQVKLHPIPEKYLERLNEPDKSHIKAALHGLEEKPSNNYWKPVIEPASSEEIAMIEERMKDYEKDPLSFVPLS